MNGSIGSVSRIQCNLLQRLSQVTGSELDTPFPVPSGRYPQGVESFIDSPIFMTAVHIQGYVNLVFTFMNDSEVAEG